MNTRHTRYGAVHYRENQNKYAATFWNPLTQRNENQQLFDTLDEAENHLNTLNFNFFCENSQFLPKGISVNRRDNCFTFNIYVRNRTIYIYASKNLNEVNDYKFEFIKQFLS